MDEPTEEQIRHHMAQTGMGYWTAKNDLMKVARDDDEGDTGGGA